jgi:hypothetical protein
VTNVGIREKKEERVISSEQTLETALMEAGHWELVIHGVKADRPGEADSRRIKHLIGDRGMHGHKPVFGVECISVMGAVGRQGSLLTEKVDSAPSASPLRQAQRRQRGSRHPAKPPVPQKAT